MTIELRSARRRLPALILLAALPGCTILPKAEDLAPRLSLDAGTGGSQTASAAMPVSFSVADPRSEAVFNTSNVAVQTAPLQYQYLEGAEWTDRAPLLLGLFLERRFENSGLFQAVGDQVSLPVADYALQTDIRAMHLDRTSAQGRAVIAYGARIVSRRGATIGTRVFSQNVSVEGNGNAGTVAALNEAAQRAADETLAWAEPLIRDDVAASERAAEERRQRRSQRGS